jgi:hypothetical protein
LKNVEKQFNEKNRDSDKMNIYIDNFIDPKSSIDEGNRYSHSKGNCACNYSSIHGEDVVNRFVLET